MALNKSIILKLAEKTQEEPLQQKYLMSIFNYESGSPGWFDNEYRKLLESIIGD